MSLTFASLNDVSGAFDSSITVVSPNMRYVVCNDYAGTTSLSDVSSALTLVWSAALSYADGGFGTSEVIALAVDDAGDVWGYSGFADYTLLQVPKSTHTPIAGYTWSFTGTVDPENGYANKLFTFTMPDASIFLVLTLRSQGTHYYTATKGVGSTLTENIATFNPSYAFQDKNGDVWIAGPDSASSLKMLRITDVASSAYPDTVQTYAIPDYTNGSGSFFSPPEIAGAVQGDNFVAAWPAQGLGGNDFTQHLMQVPLAGGSVTTSDITSTSVIFPMVSTRNADFKQTFAPNLGTIYVQYESTLLDNFDGDIFAVGRTFTALDLATMALGTEYELDSWAASDNGDGSYPTQVETNVYLASINAFAGTRFQDPSSDLFVYYIDGAPLDESRPLRAWTITQDDHDFYIIRLGSESYVFDKLTSQWCQWASPGLTYYSGSDGCDWQGFNVCCDPDSGVIHQIDPTGRLDAGTTPISTRIYGFVTTRFRKNVPMFMAEAAISEGRPPTGVDATSLGIKLRTSDTLTWTDHGTVPGKAAGSMVTARWYGLGVATAPGVEFELTDTGYARRLDGFTIELGAAAEAAISNGQ